jgi:hypothetical protein
VRALAAAALVVAGCNPPFRPVVPPSGEADGTEVRVEAMALGGRAKLQLVAHTRAGASARLERAMLTRVTRAECTGGSPVQEVAVDDAKPAKVPVGVAGEHTLVLSFTPSPEELLEAPAALDLAVDDDGRPTCVRVLLGPGRDWERWQPAFEVDLGGGVPLRTLGDVGPIYMVDERAGALVGAIDWSAGVRIGVGRCSECFETTALLPGPVVAATYYLAPDRRAGPAVELSFGSLFELMHHPSDPTGSDPRLGEWYQVPGVGLQWDWLGPPRGSKVRLRGRDFNAVGLQVVDQLWIPTLHAARPAMVLGLGLVWRLAL